MKTILISLSILFTSFTFAGGFLWPGIEYEYAKLYLLNIPFNEETPMPDHDIYKDGAYAPTKIGNGFNLSEDHLKDIHSIMARGMDELAHGLSGCFIPRHGIVYYNKKGEVVASVTICIECERLEFWRIGGRPEFHKKPANFDLKKADGQMSKLKDVLIRAAIPVYDRPDAYDAYIKRDTTILSKGEMFMHEDTNDSIFDQFFSKEEVLNWVMDEEERNRRFKESEEVKYTAGGDKYVFYQLSDNKGTDFFFSDAEKTALTDAEIVNPQVRLPNSVRIGMSSDEVIGTMGLYDGISNPAHINLIKKKYILDYYFERQTLVRITLRRS